MITPNELTRHDTGEVECGSCPCSVCGREFEAEWYSGTSEVVSDECPGCKGEATCDVCHRTGCATTAEDGDVCNSPECWREWATSWSEVDDIRVGDRILYRLPIGLVGSREAQGVVRHLEETDGLRAGECIEETDQRRCGEGRVIIVVCELGHSEPQWIDGSVMSAVVR